MLNPIAMSDCQKQIDGIRLVFQSLPSLVLASLNPEIPQSCSSDFRRLHFDLIQEHCELQNFRCEAEIRFAWEIYDFAYTFSSTIWGKGNSDNSGIRSPL